MARPTDAELDARVRGHESTLYAGYGLTHTEHTVHVSDPGVDVRVVEIGRPTDLPPILLLHGIASVTAVALPLVAALGQRRILALDWPGHGLSGRLVVDPRGDLRLHAKAVIDAVLDAFGIDTVDIVAHSLGGQFALYFVLAEPQRVRRLVLLGAPGAAFEGVNPVPAMRVMSIPGVGRRGLSLPSSPEAYLRNSDAMLGAGALDGYPPEIAAVGYAASQRSAFAPSVASFFRALITPLSVRPGVSVPLENFREISTPTLMVWGERDVFLAPDRGRASIDAIAGAEVVLVSGGHAPWLDELELTGSSIRRFLG